MEGVPLCAAGVKGGAVKTESLYFKFKFQISLLLRDRCIPTDSKGVKRVASGVVVTGW